MIFTGTRELPSSKVVEKYDPFFNMLVMPLIKYEKGFFTHTFYAQTKIDNETCDLRFKINYLSHTVTVEDLDKLNEQIKSNTIFTCRHYLNDWANLFFCSHRNAADKSVRTFKSECTAGDCKCRLL